VPADYNLMEQHIEALYIHDVRGRLARVRTLRMARQTAPVK
jgi:hypothetical protein